MERERVGVIAMKASTAVIIWERELGRVGFRKEDALQPPKEQIRLYHYGVWVSFKAERTSETEFSYVARCVRICESPQAGLESRLLPPSGWELANVLGWVVNSNENEALLWSDAVGLVTLLCKGLRGSRPPLHSYQILRLQFRGFSGLRVSDSFDTTWEVTAFQALSTAELNSLPEIPAALSVAKAVQTVATGQRERTSGNQYAFSVEGSGEVVEVLRSAFHERYDHSAQYLFALSDEAALCSEGDGRLRMQLILLQWPDHTQVLFAVPSRKARRYPVLGLDQHHRGSPQPLPVMEKETFSTHPSSTNPPSQSGHKNLMSRVFFDPPKQRSRPPLLSELRPESSAESHRSLHSWNGSRGRAGPSPTPQPNFQPPTITPVSPPPYQHQPPKSRPIFSPPPTAGSDGVGSRLPPPGPSHTARIDGFGARRQTSQFRPTPEPPPMARNDGFGSRLRPPSPAPNSAPTASFDDFGSRRRPPKPSPNLNPSPAARSDGFGPRHHPPPKPSPTPNPSPTARKDGFGPPRWPTPSQSRATRNARLGTRFPPAKPTPTPTPPPPHQPPNPRAAPDRSERDKSGGLVSQPGLSSSWASLAASGASGGVAAGFAAQKLDLMPIQLRSKERAVGGGGNSTTSAAAAEVPILVPDAPAPSPVPARASPSLAPLATLQQESGDPWDLAEILAKGRLF